MQTLHLVSVAQAGSTVVVADDDGQQYALPIDDRLRAALRGDRLHSGQTQIALGSQLSPRDIQARVRAGASVDELAAVAGVPADRVLRFAAPVLDEREHMAERARAALLRTDGMLELGSLGEVVEAALSERGGDDTLVWDAWRREDGRWLAACQWRDGSTERTALWLLDAAVGSVTPVDDDARRLAGLPPTPPTGPARLAVVEDGASDAAATAEDDTPTGPLPSVTDSAPPAGTDSAPGAAHPARRRGRARRQPDEQDRLRLSDLAEHVEEVDAPARRAPRSSRGTDTPSEGATHSGGDVGRPQRPPVPSWDEIMFGRRG